MRGRCKILLVIQVNEDDAQIVEPSGIVQAQDSVPKTVSTGKAPPQEKSPSAEGKTANVTSVSPCIMQKEVQVGKKKATMDEDPDLSESEKDEDYRPQTVNKNKSGEKAVSTPTGKSVKASVKKAEKSKKVRHCCNGLHNGPYYLIFWGWQLHCSRELIFNRDRAITARDLMVSTYSSSPHVI